MGSRNGHHKRMSKTRHMLRLVVALLIGVCAVGCDEDRGMYTQQKKNPLEGSEFFDDEGVSRHPPRGTVAAVPVRDWRERRARIETEGEVGQFVPDDQPASLPPMAELRLGQERFNIWCAPCHGMTGQGDGMIVKRGFPRPPSYHIPRLRNAPDAHFQQVMEVGLGKMPSYDDHLTDREQAAIISYIRALQLSQHTPVEALSLEQRERLEDEAAGSDAPASPQAHQAEGGEQP